MRPLSLLPAAVLLLAACDSPSRVVLDPPSLQLHARGQSLPIHASAFASNGRPLPQQICRWSSSDEKVATVSGPHNQATVTAVGPGTAAARCNIGSLTVEAQVVVRVVAKVEASPQRLELKMLDKPEPVVLEIRVFDTEGRPLTGRVTTTRCQDENVCRGDGRGQLWAVGPGDSPVFVEVEGVQTQVAAHVVDARTAEGKPRRVKGNPMLDYEKAYKALQQGK
jgi:hypothetical protein